MTYYIRLSFCLSPAPSMETSVTALLLPSAFFFLFGLPLPLMRSAWHAGGGSLRSQELHRRKLRERSVCQLSLPCGDFFVPPSPPSPGVMSTADTIKRRHANFVIGNQSASQLSHLCPDRNTVWTEKVSIIMQEGSQIEPFVFLHEGHDKEVPG